MPSSDIQAKVRRCDRAHASAVAKGKASVGQLRRKIEELIDYLLRSNPVPSAAVVLTGTGIIVTQEAALKPGDVVTIEIPEIGTLANRAETV